MLESNRTITLSGEQALQALAELEFVLISLHKMGAYYMDKPVADYQRATTDFIDNQQVTQRLALVRRILSEPFDSTLGDDDMDDIERHVQGLELWRPE
ncbi:hypothetical protein GV819_29890 [Pseudomonas sp. Fl5BN2]|uniref:hypothetical protein n=1 Tax=unclassified Pseudomonas TaxID=196821 RepID=UPI001377678B|nr:MULTISPECIES: hypothetical protein [unclassified Pseudomonas]NBF06495.1 hypothetical protein [Pseudomonas sp. Fl5BN2]NBF08999.1 hypothetical protein [Pseudomonas sp. Fl4BN1]